MLTLTQWPLLTGHMTVGLVILEINILNIKRDIISKMSGVFSQIHQGCTEETTKLSHPIKSYHLT